MTLKKLAIICLPVVITGCADLYGTQPPAPVYGGHTRVEPQTPRQPQSNKPPIKEQPSDVETTPLHDPTINPEPLQEIQAPTPIDNSQITKPYEPELDTSPSAGHTSETAQPAQTNNTPPPVTTQPPAIIVQELPKPVEEHPPLPFEPYESTAAKSPAVSTLLADASQNSQAGDLDVAVTTIERAIRIEPRNANLYYKLAVIRLKQSKPRLAEDLAKKSALLASSDKQLKKHSWLLIAKARDLQKDYDGSKEALNKANSF